MTQGDSPSGQLEIETEVENSQCWGYITRTVIVETMGMTNKASRARSKKDERQPVPCLYTPHCPSPSVSLLLASAPSLPLNPPIGGYLKPSSEQASLHSKAFGIKCSLHSFAFKALHSLKRNKKINKTLHGLCQVYHYIFISRCCLWRN